MVAQRQSALWAYVMALAAVIGMALSSIGVFLVWTTFAETREANTIARKAAGDAEREAQAARNAFILAQRAIVTIRGIQIKKAERENWFETTINILNTGESNAHRFRIDYSICEEAIFPHDEGLAKVQNMRGICTGKTSMTLPDFVIRKPSNYPRYFIGYLTYFTVHEASFKTFFCMEITGEPTYNVNYNAWTHVNLVDTYCPSLPPDT